MLINVLTGPVLLQLTTDLAERHGELMANLPSTGWFWKEVLASGKVLAQAVKLPPGVIIVEDLTDAVVAEDTSHDFVFSALHHGLQLAKDLCAEEAPRNPSKAAELADWEAIERILAFDGRAIIAASHAQEAAQPPIRAANLLPKHRDMLSALQLKDTNGLALIDRWVTHATRLGDLLNRRATVDAQGDLSADGRKARTTHVKNLGELFYLLSRSGAPAEVQTAVLAPFQEAVDRQLARNAAK